MATAPKLPEAQPGFADQGETGLSDRGDSGTGGQAADPGGADVEPGRQARYGNLKQNLTIHWQVQER